ncbi:MAG: FAD-binding oxidoreductase, partial [Pseudonocardiaceae bacterium]
MTVSMTTLHGTRTDLTDDVLETLRGQLRGQVVDSPSPTGVLHTRDVFNTMHVRRPAVIAQCSGTADVVDAVNFAREHDLAVAVRGGGHSIAGLSTIDDGMLIDLSAMRGV